MISTPTRFHLADARCAAEAGLPALVEKPPGLNVGEASALQALNPSPWIAFNRRFEPGIAALKEALPRDARLHLQLELHYRRDSWKSFDMQDDVLLDLGPHLIDLARWLTDSEILWARALYGYPGGLLAMAIVSFEPTLLGHGHLVTGDLSLAFGLLVALNLSLG